MISYNSTRFIGIDIHKKMAVFAIVNNQSKVLSRGQVAMNDLQLWATKTLTQNDRVVIEATGNSFHVYDLLNPFCAEVLIANALAMKDRTRCKRKTDKVDALALAVALAKDYIPKVWVPPVDVREQREYASHRHSLSKNLTSIRNQLRGLLYRYGQNFPGSDIISKEAKTFIHRATLPLTAKSLLISKWEIAQELLGQIHHLDAQLAKTVLKDDAHLKLITLPGIGLQTALIITSAVGEAKRFSSPKKLTSYAGLVPSVSQSADTVRYGRITKQGRNLLRWAMIEAANAAIKTKGPIQDRYQRLIRKGKIHVVAVVAIARYLLELCWYMLCRNQVFHFAKRKYLITKFRAVLRKAHGRCPINAAPSLANAVMGWNHVPISI